jgi:hypothetical protein
MMVCCETLQISAASPVVKIRLSAHFDAAAAADPALVAPPAPELPATLLAMNMPRVPA